MTDGHPARGLRLHRPGHQLGGGPARAVPGAAADRARVLGGAAARRRATASRREAGTGYWAVTEARRRVRGVQGQQELSPAENGAIIRFQPGMQREKVEMQRVMLLNQDPPEHTATRHIISRGFTPRAIGALEEIMRERAHRIVKEAVARGGGRLRRGGRRRAAAAGDRRPARRTAGGPQEAVRLVQPMLANEDPDFEGDPQAAAAEMLVLRDGDGGRAPGKNPRDDIVTKLINADKDGRGLNDDEFGYFVIMLAVAGNETTRNAITPRHERVPRPTPTSGSCGSTSVPRRWSTRSIRWATPINVFQRTALNDVEVGGVPVQEGPAGRAVLRQRQLRRGRLRGPLHLRHPARPQPAPGLRRPRRALLHRRQPGPPGDPADLRRAGRPRAGHHRLGEPRRLRHGWVNGIKELQVSYAG